MNLKISNDLSLPLSFVTQTQAILARKRMGKSYTASVQAEEMLKLKQQVLVIDYTGAWWGLRAGKDGKADGGYPIHVFGGDHADVPLEEKAGEVIAAAAVREGFSAILDLSHFRKGEALRFLAPFLETLYRMNREALHLFADECDAYAPQKCFGIDDAKALGAMNDIVRRGGIRGIGCTLISQRPAVINKDILTMCGVLTCLRVSHPKDLAPIKEWVDLHDPDGRVAEMIKSLPSLPIGTAWMWAPGWPTDPGIFQRIKIRERETFDSGATPKPGQSVRAPKTLKPVDLEKLGAQIKATLERQKADDPKELRKQIVELQRQAKMKAAPAPTKTERVEIHVVTEKQMKEFEKVVARLETEGTRQREAGEKLLAEAREMRISLGRVHGAGPRVQPPTSRPQPVRPLPAPRRPLPGDNESIPVGERATLIALAQYPNGLDRSQLTVLTGYKRSSRDAYIQRLGGKSYIAINGGKVFATEDGIAALGNDYEPLPVGESLRAYWIQRLPEGERKVLEVLVEHHPNAVDREHLVEATGYQRSSRDAYIQRLSAKELVEIVGRGQIKASDNLFDLA